MVLVWASWGKRMSTASGPAGHRVEIPKDRLIQATTLREHARGSPVVETGVTFFQRGEPKVRSLKVIGRDLVLTRLQMRQSFSAYTVPGAGWLCFHIPLSWQGEYYFDRREMDRGEAILTDAPSGYFARGTDRDNFTIGVFEPRLTSAIAALSDHFVGTISFHHFLFNPGPALFNAIAIQLLHAEQIEQRQGASGAL